MKNLFVILALTLSIGSSLSANAGKETITIKTQIYCDHCLKCGSCGGRINKKFPYIKGVSEFKFDDKAMTFTLTYNPEKTTPEKIKVAIAAIGYDADEVKADPKAVAKFDDCCLKH